LERKIKENLYKETIKNRYKKKDLLRKLGRNRF